MKQCKRCGNEKSEREFPYRADFVCLACHRQLAYYWNELPWADQKFNERRKRANARRKLKLDSTKALEPEPEAV